MFLLLSLLLTAPLTSSPRIRAVLGEEPVKLLLESRGAEVGWLRVRPALEAEQVTLSSPQRVVGYPPTGKLVAVDREKAGRLIEILLRDDSYSFGRRMRCANQRLIGMRFLDSGAEFAIGVPCYQAFWAFRRHGKVERAGEAFSEAATEAIKAIVLAELEQSAGRTAGEKKRR
jgi:hypothetical protein